MIKLLKCDFRTIMFSFSFLAATFVTFLLCFTENIYIDSSTMQAFSVFEVFFKFNRSFMERNFSFCSLSVFKSALYGYSAMFLPVLASFPFAFSQSVERNSGNIRFSIFRTKRLKYYFSKFICAVTSGGVCIMLGVLIFVVFSSFVFPGIQYYPYLSLEHYAPDGVLAEIWKKLLSSFIYGGINAVPAFFLSSFCRNRYIILCVPFLMRFMLDTAIKKITTNSTNYNIYEMVFPYLEAGSMLYSTITVMVIFLAVMLLGYIIIMEHRTDKGE